jgi:hypothetical protein
MQKLYILAAVVLLSVSIPSCQDYVCENKLDGIKGRLWFNPNPIRFPYSEVAIHDTPVLVTVANTGTEVVSIEAVSLEGGPDFYFDEGFAYVFDPSTGALEFPIGFSGSGEDCSRCGTAGFPVFCRQGTGYLAEGTLIIETSDPTSPTLEVPMVVDPDNVLPEDHSYPVGVIPIVKPNPIRFRKRTNVGEWQTLEVCLRLEGAAQSSKITRLELHGENFGIQAVFDANGGEISHPLREYNIGQDTLKILVDNRPVTDDRKGGTLEVEFTDDLGDQRTLLVPILDNW